MAKHTIIICGNDEELTNGNFLSLGDDFRDEAAEIVRAGASVVLNAKHDVDYEIESNFTAWNGGYCYTVGNTIRGTVFGYGCGHAVTQSRNPPKWLTKLIDKVSDAISKKTIELSRKQTAQIAQDVIDQVESEEEPCQFVIDNLSRDELTPEMLAKFDAAVETWQSRKEVECQ